ncbi:hypothetical protein CDAR_253301 [Caerostris darwini]|uniref:Uncharacterized protein n=1 Tax=Caerostris darwini TaxID=1538125 RepID=A0AAV4U8Q7_9ARAC|nr:hypothetical protein CDAR_253301 [Caerostris darwini]
MKILMQTNALCNQHHATFTTNLRASKCNMAAMKMSNKHPAILIIKKPLSLSPGLLPVSSGHVYLEHISACDTGEMWAIQGNRAKIKAGNVPQNV